MPQIVCPECRAANRLPEGKDPGAANCGRCKARLFQGKPVEVSGQALDAHLANTKGAAVLLDVWAPWCGPCRAMAPQFEAAAQRLEPNVRLVKLNSDAEPDAAARLGVQGIPALFLFKDGKVVARHAGAMPAAQLVAWTEQELARAG
jgi:thioredoxin 2